jgi:hypothetical protein
MSNPDPQWYVCCGGPLLCPAVFGSIFFQNHYLLSISIPLLILFSFFYFLSSIVLEFSKCLIKTQLITKQHPNKFSNSTTCSTCKLMHFLALRFKNPETNYLRTKVKSTEPCSVQSCKSLSLSRASCRCS